MFKKSSQQVTIDSGITQKDSHQTRTSVDTSSSPIHTGEDVTDRGKTPENLDQISPTLKLIPATPDEARTTIEDFKKSTHDMDTSTNANHTQEIETQVEAKQYHEQSCQSEGFPEPKPEPEQQKSTSASNQLDQLRQQFADLHKNLRNWLEETEEMVENQKPPSADYKVVRAQLQNHDFQTKMVDDKQESVDKLLSLAGQLQHALKEAGSDDENTQIQQNADEIGQRFDGLAAEVHRRRQLLLDAQELANDFNRTQKPLSSWLEDASNQVTALCKVVTSKEEIEANIAKQEVNSTKNSRCDKNLTQLKSEIRLYGAWNTVESQFSIR